MGLAVKIYEAFKDDEIKARALSEVIDELDNRTASLHNVVTKDDLEVVKLSLQKEIEQVRGEVEQVRLGLQKEIEQVRGEVKQVRLSLQKEIEQVRGEVEQVRLSLQKEIERVRGEVEQVKLTLQKEIEQVRVSVIKWVAGLLLVQTGLIISIITLIK